VRIPVDEFDSVAELQEFVSERNFVDAMDCVDGAALIEILDGPHILDENFARVG
jgi:hypothetical protein